MREIWQVRVAMKNISLTLIVSALVATSPAFGAADGPDYVAHEWGTFTSVQGSDGKLIHWNPFVSTDLPDFVLTRARPRPFTPEQFQKYSLQRMIGKNTSHWLQRMETPVIYFYAEEDFEVDVDVAFPKGLITEWYPAVSTFGPVGGLDMKKEVAKRRHAAWNDLLVLGGSRNTTLVPKADVPSHYFTARTKDASPVRVQNALHPKQVGQEEQFLFYRGAGNFETPLHVSMNDNNTLKLENRGASPIGRMFVYRHDADSAVFRELEGLKSGERMSAQLDGVSSDQLPGRLVQALVEAGLFQSEAEAMVNTWKNDWLGDRGLRVLYLLSQEWTDQTLPLKLDPTPREVVRVMVGRAEVVPPEIEIAVDLALSDQLNNGRIDDLNGLQKLLEPRFLEPAVTGAVKRRVSQIGLLPLGKDEMLARKNSAHKSGGELTALLRYAVQERIVKESKPGPEKVEKLSQASPGSIPWVAPVSLFYCGAPLTAGVSPENAR